MNQVTSAAVLVATFRRPEMLSTLLSALSHESNEVSANIRIIVVDNDPGRSAAEVVERYPQVVYRHEPTPGIAAARNAGLRALETEDAFVFIDDDEVPDRGWLGKLLDVAEETGADVVTGPVIPIFGPEVPLWLEAGGFWRRENHPDGEYNGNVATNNTLVRTRYWAQDPVDFDQRLSLKGGSDTEFFRRLAATRDGLVIWAGSAVVREAVLPERANARWLLRRAVRIGNVNGRYQSAFRSAAGGIVRVLVGAPLTAVDRVSSSHYRARSLNMLGHGIGMLGVALGREVHEYRRRENS